MSNNRCGNCGFLNFDTASACKQCAGALNAPWAWSDNPYFNNYMAGMQGGSRTAPGVYAQPAYAPSYIPGPIAQPPRPSKVNVAEVVLMALVGLIILVGAWIAYDWHMVNKAPRNFAWHEYKARDDSYTFQMPVKPVEKVVDRSSAEGELKMYMMLADMHQRGAFIVGHADYPEDFTEVEAEEMLDLSAQGFVASSGATLLNKKNIMLEGYPGLELEMQPPGRIGKSERSVTRIYWAAPRIYLMFAGGPKSAETDAALEKFFNSLKLRKEQTQQSQPRSASY